MSGIKDVSYYEKLFDNAYEPILLIDGNHFIDGNQAALNTLSMTSKDELSVIHPGQLSPLYQPDGKLSQTKADEMISICYEKGFHRFEWLHKDLKNREFLVEVTLKTITIKDKKLLHVVWRDIEERKQFEEDLKKQNQILIQKNNYINEINSILQNDDKEQNLLETLSLLEEYKKAIDESSIVSKTNPDGIIIYVNEKFCEISGYSKEELIGKNHNIIRHKDTKESFFISLWETIKSKKIFRGIVKNKKKSGESYYVDSTIIPILDKNGDIIEYIGIRHDITTVFEKDKQIHEQFTDDLTHLPNRQKLLDDVKKVISPKLALINIDRFKDINDSYGLDVGDKILRELKNRLLLFKSSNLRVYRIAGDVFAFLAIGNYSVDSLFDVCKEFILRMDKNSFYIEDNEFDVSFTIGIAADDEKILTHAEIALTSAKSTNKDIVVFDEQMPIYKELKRNLELTKDIKIAINSDNILIYGQKIIDNNTNEVKYETLMRMKNANGDIVSPFLFLEHAKKARLYPKMTKAVIKKACDYFKEKNTKFSINLMIEDIKNEKTIEFLFDKLKETNTSSKVILEIVESEGIEKFDEVEKFIKKAKELGCAVAIDDFGTGYSNFEYIIRLNVDILKIDGSLIKNVHIDKNIRLTVSTIVNFAKVLGIKTVAEFVHCDEVQNIVKDMGIDFSQGFLLHEPEVLN